VLVISTDRAGTLGFKRLQVVFNLIKKAADARRILRIIETRRGQHMTDKLRPSHAFTLIEMIGVLAVIALLAALLIPKIFESINNARIGQAVLSCQTIKTATL